MDAIRYQKINDGLAVFLPNARSKTYWVRYRINGKEHKMSTQERDIQQAIKKAYYIMFDMNDKLERGISIEGNTINSHKDNFIEYLSISKKTTTKDYIRIFENWVIPVIGKKRFNEVSGNDIINIYHKNNISSKTQTTMTKSVIKRLFQYGENNNLLKPTDRPMIPDNIAKTETINFDIFTKDEFAAIFQKLDDQIGTGKGERSKLKKELMKIYYEMLSTSGARAGSELLKIKFKDIELTDEWQGVGYYRWREAFINIRHGKMAKRKEHRKIPLLNNCAMSLYFFLRMNYGKYFVDLKSDETEMEYMIKHHPDKYLFSYPDNNTVPDFEHNFKDLIDELKAEGKIDKNKRIASYSFRHHFITQALVQGIDIYLLSELVGNSPDIIYNTYSKLAATVRKDEIYKIDIDWVGDKKRKRKERGSKEKRYSR